MSNSQRFTDASEKAPSDNSKFETFDSCRTDSGFISGEIIDSGTIEEEDPPQPAAALSGPTVRDSEKSDPNEQMYIFDSGVGLTDDFSKISIGKEEGLNDFSQTKCQQLQPPVAPKAKEDNSPPWKIYYAQNDIGDTHLHEAIAGGYEKLAYALIMAAPHPDFLDIQNDDDQTPLHLAVATNQHRIARLLIVAGAKPGPRDFQGDSPLHIAARTNSPLCVHALAAPVKKQEREELPLGYPAQAYKQCDFDQWNYLGQTCVHVAAFNGNLEVLHHLVCYGANVNAREGCSGYSALHFAAQRCDEPILHFLLQCKGIDPEVVTYGGKTALEVNPGVTYEITTFLRSNGVPTPYPSDDEAQEDSEDEMMYENARMFSRPWVNANA